MLSVDCAPTRAQFRPGEPIGLSVSVKGEPHATVTVRAEVTGGAPAVDGQVVATFGGHITLDDAGWGSGEFSVSIENLVVPTRGSRGFAVSVDADGAVATTAFDIAEHWSHAPRYGFFADFAKSESDDETQARADRMATLHLNVIQFYDWMYSHHTLVPPSDDFVDPLGRELSLEVVRRKVTAAHERGMAALGYGALYGAEAEFANAHADWLLYDGKHEPLQLADIFYLQDIREVSPWRRWIIDQFRDATERVGFDGIHIDQYGYPKRSLSRVTGDWEVVELTEEFMGFVQQACLEISEVAPDGGSIFNLVNAWPLDRIGQATTDAATYIEVWDPHSTYRDLYDLVVRARTLRPEKHVILSAYLRAFHPDDPRPDGALTAFRLAQATIGSAGGFHLILGEGDGLLTEAYYPSYGKATADAGDLVRSYADFAVRNTSILHADAPDVAWTQVGGTNDVVLLEHPALAGAPRGLIDTGELYGAGAVPGTVWAVQREVGNVSALALVNLMGLTTDHWNSSQPEGPRRLDGIALRASVTGDITAVWWDTPDDAEGTARPLAFRIVETDRGRFLEFTLPSLDVWSLVWWARA